MKILKFKIYLKIILSFFLSKFISLLNRTRTLKVQEYNHYIFFLYGGIGDQLLLVNLINSLSINNKVSIFIDNRFEEIELFLPKANIINYTKKNKFKLFNNLRNIDKNTVFVSHSSSVELQILYLVSNCKYFLGFNGSYNDFFFNLNLKNLLLNKYEIYNKLFFDCLDLNNDFNFLNNYQPNEDIINKFKLPIRKYMVLNINKTHYWGNVSIPVLEWSNLINQTEILSNYTLVLVGNGPKESELNNKLINSVKKKSNIINLANKTNLIELSSIIYFCYFLITNDTGIMHLANLLRKKNISLFTFSDPKIFADYDNSIIIHNNKHKCQPCVSKSLRGNENYPPNCKYNFACSNTIKSIDLKKIISDYLNNQGN